MQTDGLKMFIPISLELDWPTREAVIEEIRFQHTQYGFDTFALACPGGGWRSYGYPPTEQFRSLAELFRSVKEVLAPEGIHCGWWITATVKAGRDADFQPMIRADGNETPFSSCLLDPAFQARFCGNVALFADIAEPEFILTEDDFSVNASTFSDGCFCPLHLAAFASRVGKSYAREELLEIFAQTDEAALALHREWRRLIRDTMVQMATLLRRAVDEKHPEIPMGYMESGSAVSEGDCTEAVARAMAGARHTPFSRICGCYYGEVDTQTLPQVLYHPLWQRQRIARPFLFIHESDTFPHTRFFSSATHVRAMLGAVYSYGYEGSVMQTQQLLDDANEEPAYGRMFRAERTRLTALSRLANECTVRGVSVPTFAECGNGRTPDFIRCLSHFGIPHTTLPAQVAFWDGEQAKSLSDEAILAQLGKGLFLDGAAAKVLCARGFGAYLGVSVGAPLIRGKQFYDLGEREVICEGFARESRGRNMPSAHMLANANGELLSLTVTDARCEIVSQAVDFRRNVLGAAMTRFENALGGRVVVMGMTVANNRSQSLLNYRRQKLFQELLLWCGGDCAFVRDEPKIFLIQNECNSDAFLGLLTLINLSEDTVPEVKLHLPQAWQTATPLRLAQDGNFCPIAFTRVADGILLREPLAFLQPMYLKF